jgi:streptogramin lyase
MTRAVAVCALVLSSVLAFGAASARITVTLASRPTTLGAGTAWNAILVVRSDGRPAAGAAPQLVARMGPTTRTFRAVPTGRTGTYRARVILLASGRWILSARLRGRTYALGSIGVRARGETYRVRQPYGLAVAPDGTVVFANGPDHRVLRIDPRTRRLTLVAGTGRTGFSGDGGLAMQANVEHPIAVATDRVGNVFVVADARIRRIDAASGTITTIAGTGEDGYSGDGGPATSARLRGMTAVAVDGAGNLYVAEYAGRIRRIDAATGIIRTIAGTGVERSGGDGGPGLSAQIDRPHGVAVAADGAIVVTDTYGARIRRIDPSGTITTIAGTGIEGDRGDGGPAMSAELRLPAQMAIAPDAGIVFSDHGNNRIRRIAPDGRISTVAPLLSPGGVAVDSGGIVYAGGLDPPRVIAVDPSTGSVRELAS